MSTVLKEDILKSESGQRMLDMVSPIYHESYVALWTYEAIGREYDLLRALVDSLGDQLVPERCTWLIGMWEERYGITPPANATLDARRKAVILARNRKASGNDRLETWLSVKTGGTAKVIDNIDDFTFGIDIDLPNDISSSFDLDEAIAYINKRKPSHLSYTLDFESYMRLKLYAGTALYGHSTQNMGSMDSVDIDSLTVLADGNGVILTDGLGATIFDI